MKKLIVLSLLIVFALSCRTKKQTTISQTSWEKESQSKKDSTSSDSVHISIIDFTNTETVITKPSNQKIVITDPCDSVTGLLRQIQSSAGNSSVTTVGNTLVFDSKCEESVNILKESVKEKDQYIEKLKMLNTELRNSLAVKQALFEDQVKTKAWSWLPFYVGVAAVIILIVMLRTWFPVLKKWI